MRSIYRIFWLPLYRRWALWYIRRERPFRYGRLRLQVPPGVFHPGVFFSTPMLLDFLQNQALKDKKVLDLGTGSGVLALFAAQQNARVIALDVNPLALETAHRNALQHDLDIQTIESDLLDQLPSQQFDRVLVNPPYYPKNPVNLREHAFFAGENLEYFDRLFRDLPAYLHLDARVWMILSEDCALQDLKKKALENGLSWNIVLEKQKWGERFYIVELRPEPKSL